MARLIDKLWRLERLRRYEGQVLQNRIDRVQAQNSAVPVRAKLKALGPGLPGPARRSRWSSSSPSKVLTARLSLRRCRVPRRAKEPAWGAAIAEHLQKIEVESIIKGPSEVLTYIDPFKLELDEDRMARLDDEILKLTKRLVQVTASK